MGERRVGPGDVILVHAGLYKSDRLNYPLSLPFDGTYMLAAKGTPDRPIVIRAAGDGEPIFDGDGAARLFDVAAADYHIFEGLTVRRCRLEDVGIGVTALWAGSEDFYIADNVFLGRDDRFRLLGWYSPGIYGANQLRSYYAIKLYGSGHVVCHNTIAYFHDGITVCTHGSPDPDRVEPTKRYADIIIPEGGHNRVALETIVARIRALL